jgi:hypothetical protein
MALTPDEIAAAARAAQYNSGPYNVLANKFGMAVGGHRINFPTATADVALLANAVSREVTGVQTIANGAQASANAAAASAAAAAQSALDAQAAEDAAVAAAAAAAMTSGATGTSTTALALSAGTKTLTTQTGKDWVPGMSIALASSGDPANRRMGGLVVSYTKATGAMTVLIATDDIIGTGTYSDWVLGPSGRRGARGTDGSGSTVQFKANNVAIGGPQPVLNIAGPNVSAVLDTANNTANIIIGQSVTPALARWLAATASL